MQEIYQCIEEEVYHFNYLNLSLVNINISNNIN